MCGFVGFVGDSGVSDSIKLSLQAMQHRGQDSAGLGLIYNNSFLIHKDLGYVAQSLKSINYNGAGLGIGHVRYPTIGGGIREDAQPFFSRQPGMIMAHNGNIINYNEIKAVLKKHSINLSSKCDVEPVLYILCEQLMNIRSDNHSIYDVVLALKETYKITKGAFTLVGGLFIDGKPTMFCCRDPYGIRPGVWGEKDGNYICASESVCIDVIDFDLKGDVPAGEVMFFRQGEQPQTFVIEKAGKAPCTFENIYFARPDSISNGRSIYSTRIDLGRVLGEEFLAKGIEVDVVVPVPDTSDPAASSIAEVIKRPIRDGLVKNRYSARTFIMPTQSSREHELRLKLNPIKSQIEGKRILLIDDSIVRGTTLKRMVSLIKQKGGAKEIHLAITSPAVLNPCFYGIDMSVQEDLIAYRKCVKMGLDPRKTISLEDQRKLEVKIAENLGADSLTYLSIEGLNRVFGKDRCAACFDGQYPIQIEESYANEIRKDRMGVSCNCNPVNT
ncbi:MAG: amidophosphoribosyltransferase [bacterium]